MDEDIQRLIERSRYPEALEQLLNRYERKVFRMALAFLREPNRAEEVTQDIFVKIWRAMPDYDGRASPGTWLYAIARNTCLSATRSEAYRKTVPLDAIAEPAASTDTASLKLELERLVGRLPPIQRAAITLFYLEDKRVDEVATLLQMPEGTVKSHLHRARRSLGEMIRNNDHEL